MGQRALVDILTSALPCGTNSIGSLATGAGFAGGFTSPRLELALVTGRAVSPTVLFGLNLVVVIGISAY